MGDKMKIYEMLEFYIFIIICIFLGALYINQMVIKEETNNNIELNLTPKKYIFNNESLPFVTLTFDDGWESQYNLAYPILKRYNYQATAFVIPPYIDVNPGYMTKLQLRDLQNQGWDISSHYYGNFENKTDLELEAIFIGVKTWLVLNNFTGGDFLAYPQGRYQGNILNITKNYFYLGRTVHQIGQEYPPEDRYILSTIEPARYRTLEEDIKLINESINKKQWIILTFHKIVEAEPQANTEYTKERFEALMAYINSTGIPVKTIGNITRAI